MALCAVYAVLGGTAAIADCGICLHRCDRKLYDTEFCEFLYKVRSDKHIYLFVGYRTNHHNHLPAIGLPRSIYHGDGRLQDTAGDGDAIHSAYVDKFLAPHDCDSGAIPYVRSAIGRRGTAVWYGV